VREQDVDGANYRVGHFPSEMLRRAMDDARAEREARGMHVKRTDVQYTPENNLDIFWS